MGVTHWRGRPPCCNLLAHLPLKDNHNLFVALRAPFPPISTPSRSKAPTASPCVYTWRDLERGTAMIANLLASLDLPAGARSRRADREVGRGDDAVPGGAARRAMSTCRSTPPTRAARSSTSSATPSRAVVVAAAQLRLGQRRSPARRRHAPHVLHARRRPQRQPAGAAPRTQRPACGRRASRPTTWPRSSTPAARPGAARARC